MSRGQIALLAAVLAIATGFAYANSFRGPFIFDDKPAILENTSIRHLGDLAALFSPPAIGSSVTGRPVVNVSFALNYALSGTAPWSYHATNLIIHVLAGLALFGFIRRTLELPALPARLREFALPTAFASAALWLLHPLQTESVTSIVQRTESLVGLWYLVTLYCFVRGATAARPKLWFASAVIVCAIGMATKEVMVTVPVVVLWYDRTFLAGTLREAWRRRRKFHLALGATWVVLAALVLTAGGTRGEAAGFGLGVTPWTYALTQCRALVLYLKLVFWPHPLVLDYGTDVARQLGEVLPQAVLVLALVSATVWAAVRRPLLAFGAVWFFVVIAPSSSVVPLVSQTIAEHRMYLPLAGVIALALAAGVLRFGRIAVFAALALAVAGGAATFARNRDYATELAIWADTATKAPRNARAQVNLAECLILLGQPESALAPAEAAVELKPNYPEAQTNLGIALTQLGRPADGLPHCEEAVRLQPEKARNRNNLGATLIRLDRAGEAVPQFQAALRLTPDPREAAAMRQNLGAAYLFSGNPAAAIPEFEEALRVTPGSADLRYPYGLALAQVGRVDDAVREFETVLRIQPGHAGARRQLEIVGRR